MDTSSLFDDFSKVVSFVIRNLRIIITNFYENPRFNFLFNMALLPVILLFAFDLLFSFILSFKSRKLVLFNVISVKSWSSIKALNNQNRLKADTHFMRQGTFSNLRNKSADFQNRLKPNNLQLRYNASSRTLNKILLKMRVKKSKSFEGKVFSFSHDIEKKAPNNRTESRKPSYDLDEFERRSLYAPLVYKKKNGSSK